MSLNLVVPSPIQQLHDSILNQHQITLYLKRDDLIHPHISGNKWRKLKYNIQQAKHEQQHTLLTFGGAYSNHLTATAAAGKYMGFSTIGIVRGEKHPTLNPALQFATQCGMQLHYISRQQYRQKHDPKYLQSLHQQFGRFYRIPEGGSNLLALQGCHELLSEIPYPFEYICCACGTGATLAGIISAVKNEEKAIGFSALKGHFLQGEVSRLLTAYTNKTYNNWHINTDYHFGGYAKKKPALLQFMHWFHQQHHIPLDFVYTGKLLYGIYALIQQGFFAPHTRIVAVHTGGVQNGGL
jgi:1-aminocyclopropane-1-carboxylate deaminase/D-cysteine desulfhydrase-like pyridoxal-dependent ACC family enzyme